MKKILLILSFVAVLFTSSVAMAYNEEPTMQEANRLTIQQLLDDPVRVITPDIFYYKALRYTKSRRVPEDIAYQAAYNMAGEYEAKYLVKYGE